MDRRSAYLAALGIEPLVLRRAPAAASVAVEPATTAAAPATGVDDGLFAPRPARLCLRIDGVTAFDGPHARLLRALVRAVGVAEAEVGFDARDGVPVLVFDAGASDALAASPAALRTSRAKRAAWPQLRRLRRRLREGA